MRRMIFAVHIRRGLYILLMFLSFMILLPILIVGVGTDKSKINEAINKGKSDNFNLKSSEINFNNVGMEAPKLKVYIKNDNRVEEMNLEEYVRGVVAGEMPVEFGTEAIKAQAVAARTYAIAHMEQYGGANCSQGNGADVCNTVHCQVYMSRDERFNSWPESNRVLYWNKISEAVKATAGQVITYNGKIAMDIRYFSTSSGRTEDAVEVFSVNAPYLKSVNSPGEESSPKFKSVTKFTYAELSSKINSAYPSAKVSSSKLSKQIAVSGPRSQGGSILQIKVGEITITGNQFRTAVGLNSANFELKFNKNDIEITTHGYGHGLGMSQWGANAMSKEGKSYEDILTHYYQGVKIEKLYK